MTNDGKIQEYIIRPRELKQFTGLSVATVRRLERSGDFPSRRQLGPKSVGWLSSEIFAWIASRAQIVSAPVGVPHT
jgi:prophage regulatory protein